MKRTVILGIVLSCSTGLAFAQSSAGRAPAEVISIRPMQKGPTASRAAERSRGEAHGRRGGALGRARGADDASEQRRAARPTEPAPRGRSERAHGRGLERRSARAVERSRREWAHARNEERRAARAEGGAEQVPVSAGAEAAEPLAPTPISDEDVSLDGASAAAQPSAGELEEEREGATEADSGEAHRSAGARTARRRASPRRSR